MARQVGRLRAWAEFAAIAPLWGSLRALPIDQAVRVGAAVGLLLSKVDFHNRAIARRNLTIAYPDMKLAERASIERAMYRNLGRMAAEWVHFFDLDPTNIQRYVTYDGRENIDEGFERSRGKGLLVLTGHFGNFELLSFGHAVYGNRVAIVQRPNRNPVLDNAVAARRHRFGNATVPRKGAAREILRLLRENWMVAVPLDLDTRHGVFVDFFGLPAATNPALARIAMMSGAPVMPGFMVREGKTARSRITLFPAIDVPNGGNRRATVQEYTQRFTSIIEAMIRRYPDHWNWIHRRWKTRPNGEPRFY